MRIGKFIKNVFQKNQGGTLSGMSYQCASIFTVTSGVFAGF